LSAHSRSVSTSSDNAFNSAPRTSASDASSSGASYPRKRMCASAIARGIVAKTRSDVASFEACARAVRASKTSSAVGRDAARRRRVDMTMHARADV